MLWIDSQRFGVAAPPGGTFTDNFTDTNGTAIASHTPDVGGAWTEVVTGHQIQSNQLKDIPGGAASSFDPGVPDGTLTVTVSFPANAIVVISLRQVDGSNVFYFAISNPGNFCRLTRYVAGTGTDLDTQSITLADDTPTELKAELSGDSIKLYVAGTKFIDVSDSAHATGHVFRLYSDTANTLFDTLTFVP